MPSADSRRRNTSHIRLTRPSKGSQAIGGGRDPPSGARALTEFAQSYADRNEKDFEALGAAVRSGRVTAKDL